MGIKKLGLGDAFYEETPTYWYCKGDGTFWKDAVHVRADDNLNKPHTYVEVKDEIWKIKECVVIFICCKGKYVYSC